MKTQSPAKGTLTVTGTTKGGKPWQIDGVIKSIESCSGDYREKWKGGAVVSVRHTRTFSRKPK